MPKTTKDLPQIIRDHEGIPLELWLDNDYWRLSRMEAPGDPRPDGDETALEEWFERQVLAEADDTFTDPEHGGCCWGDGILRALCELRGITVEDA